MSRDPKEELVDHLPALRAFAVNLTRNVVSADDLVQDTVVKAWSNFDKFQTGTNLRAWLFTILRNTFYSTYRKRRREVEDPEGAIVERLSIKPDHDGRLAFKDFLNAFAELSDEQREVLILVGAEGFSYEEAAEMCGVKIGTIKSRTNRARQKLAELMSIEDGDLEMTDPATLAVITRAPAA